MKVSMIRFTQRANCGNYEHVEFTAEAVIDDTDKVGDATESLRDFVDWHAQKTTRDQRFVEFSKEVALENTRPERRAKLEKWMETYRERQGRMEAM